MIPATKNEKVRTTEHPNIKVKKRLLSFFCLSRRSSWKTKESAFDVYKFLANISMLVARIIMKFYIDPFSSLPGSFKLGISILSVTMSARLRLDILIERFTSSPTSFLDNEIL